MKAEMIYCLYDKKNGLAVKMVMMMTMMELSGQPSRKMRGRGEED